MKHLKYYLLSSILYLLFPSLHVFSQNNDSLVLRRFFTAAMSDTTSYSNLRYLCTKIGGRICGSPQAEKAVQWTKKVLDGMNLDTVWLQEINVLHWERGSESLVLTKRVASNQATKSNKIPLHACAIGGSVATPPNGITAKVVEVFDNEGLKKLGKDKIKGKIVFINHTPNPAVTYTFDAYGEVARYRVRGANEAAKYGAIGVVVRSATLANDQVPHTGIMHYADTLEKLPAMSISTKDADKLSKELKSDPTLTLTLKIVSSQKPEAKSYNVIGEIKGSEFPDQVIVFGGHLDAWDKGQGAHDDGAGVVQTIEVLRLFKTLGIKPKHTIRVVAFMDEEMDQRGAKAYADYAIGKSHAPLPSSKFKIPTAEVHLAAIEADRGGFTPTGFDVDGSPEQVTMIQSWSELFLPYGLYKIQKGGSGVDVGQLKPLEIPLIALVTDSQRYFDYHHSDNDTFDKVNQRELQLGSFSLAALVYLIDQRGNW